MTYYEAALRVLKFVGQPLTAREITDQAIEAGLIAPAGKTPYATMSAALYPPAPGIVILKTGRTCISSGCWGNGGA